MAGVRPLVVSQGHCCCNIRTSCTVRGAEAGSKKQQNMEGFVEDSSSTTNPEAYSASLANVVSVFLFFDPGSHVDGIFPPR